MSDFLYNSQLSKIKLEKLLNLHDYGHCKSSSKEHVSMTKILSQAVKVKRLLTHSENLNLRYKFIYYIGCVALRLFVLYNDLEGE